MAAIYQKFLTVLVKWPLCPESKSRDYALHLRNVLKQHCTEGDFFPGKPADVQKMLNSLVRLAENRYGLKYPGTHKVGASGMVPEDIKVVLSDEFIEYFNKSHSIYSKVFK